MSRPTRALIGWVTGGEKPAARNTLGFRPLDALASSR